MEKVSVTVQKVVTAVQGLAHVADTRENPLDKVTITIHMPLHSSNSSRYTNIIKGILLCMRQYELHT
jgi:hypothetical protein